MDSKVFIMDTNAFDYTPAEAYGEVVSLRAQNFASGSGDDSWNKDVIHALRKQLQDYKPMTDWLIPTGKPLKMCVVTGIVLTDHGPKHQFLSWDAMHYRYVPYTIDVSAA